MFHGFNDANKCLILGKKMDFVYEMGSLSTRF